MKEHPIIFTAESVRAILDGRKTQTRRVVKATHHYGGGFPSGYTRVIVGFHSPAPEEHLPAVFGASFRNDLGADWLIACPYGVPGDRLWVRETWGRRWHHAQPTAFYRATDGEMDCEPEFDGWRPSIHMPRWASRLTLEVVSVRVERVQEISGKDCIAEGVVLPVSRDMRPLLNITDDPQPNKFTDKHPREWGIDDFWRHQYAILWDSINGKKPGCSWADNPWCWVIEFKRVSQ